MVVSDAGYGLFGCVEELTDEEINHIIATNLTGSIQLLKTALPCLREYPDDVRAELRGEESPALQM